MDNKTAKEIQGDFYKALKGSSIDEAITGTIYRAGMRPANSTKEDLVIIYTAGENGRMQTGVLTLHVFVPDITPFADNLYYENAARTAEVERIMQNWYNANRTIQNSDGTHYHITLYNTITTEEDTDINQHFVVMQIQYRIFY
jgi:hypothetical protein